MTVSTFLSSHSLIYRENSSTSSKDSSLFNIIDIEISLTVYMRGDGRYHMPYTSHAWVYEEYGRLMTLSWRILSYKQSIINIEYNDDPQSIKWYIKLIK